MTSQTTPQMTPLEIIKEVTQPYIDNPNKRAISDDGCFYYLEEDGIVKNCLIGACLKPGCAIKFRDGEQYGSVITNPEVLDHLQEKYKGYPFEFWHKLQCWHDSIANWDDNGLTLAGKQKLQEIKDVFC